MNLISDFSQHFHRRKVKPKTIIIHYISCRYTHPKNPYDMEEILGILERKKLSYHEIIDREGDCHQLVHPENTAWHAGIANLFGLKTVNDRSIGIAYAGKHEDHPTNSQYQGLAKRCREFLIAYPSIKPNWILGHDMVAGDWVRGKGEGKIDPGPNFNYSYLYQLIYKEMRQNDG